MNALRKLLVALVVATLCGCDDDAQERVRLVTTTSTEASGLATWLFQPFEEEFDVQVQVVAVGTGQALELGRRGDADLVVVHARESEDEFVDEGWGIDRRDLMWNDFVVVGPADDPAGVRGLADADGAFARIKETRARFVSRGDDSGTHMRERSIWRRAGGHLDDPSEYLEAGQGMGSCLLLADQRLAYLLTDRGTWLAFRSKVGLEALVEGDPALRNPYGIILVNPERHPHVNAEAALALRDWLVSPAGQARIGAYEIDGEVLFHPAEDGA
ncbi:MAG TPA: substrate-binding domain-containing protein [Myxococcota bacterium]|nr:substrate-binding domain-containing protein [Myxococcota bacterium]